ncbi:MAG: nucleotidyl transferase AbiEii/AbiGii toxin family protein [Planctomycetes bacterium]|nr:nucleotidyl transferase AbiEii/AbiGii toxin family protein [Planctomycetota bacterium]
MKARLDRPATPDRLFVWVLHRFAEVFEEHAVVKGGIALRLHDCPRSTTDIDYVFVPFRSKKDVVARLKTVLAELEGADVEVETHSKMIRARIVVDGAAIQIEANVDVECPSVVVPTADFALRQGQPSRLVRVMALERALAHKLAAWNERRLLRDLYDVYYLAARLGAKVDVAALQKRLRKVESRLPALKGKKSMTMGEFAAALRRAAERVDDATVRDQLAPVLPGDEVEGLVPRLRAGVIKVVEGLERLDAGE